MLFAVAAIFMYHHVASAVAPGAYARALTVTPAEFSRQLAWLQARGCATRTVTQLVAEHERMALRGCEVALTFDDAYDDAAAQALPALQRFDDEATFYATSGFIGSAGHLTIGDVRALGAADMEIGAHSVSHLDLTTLSPERLAHEVVDAKSQLERWTRTPVRTFAYPAGQFNANVEAVVRRAGYDSAAGTQAGRLDAATIDPFALPRYRVLRGGGTAFFALVLGPDATAPNIASLRGIARERAEGNDLKTAERVALVLLEGEFPEQILKVKTLNAAPADVAGIMLSGVKFHAHVSAAMFERDVAAMIARAFAAEPKLTEVDVWAVVPLPVAATATVAGDYAVPTSRTVFSAALSRAAWQAQSGQGSALGETYWDGAWRAALHEE